ncbi:MAG TPA: hypothetical protein VFQ78_07340 [Candidatus Udaeobacter sp.]|jgi:hypothetical protein|nr:hypothetical protein [Candidatus Udaeobacter sp.]
MSTKEPYHDHERTDADVISLSMILLFLALSGIAIFIGVTLLMNYFETHEPTTIAGRPHIQISDTRKFRGPRLEVNIATDLARLREAERIDLSTYGWVDRNAGIVRVPIDRAMELLLKRGLPDVGSEQTPLSMQQARPSETAAPPRLQMPNEP